MATPSERQSILSEIARLADVSMRDLWRQVADLSEAEFATYIVESFPDVVDPFASLAAATAAEWYDEAGSPKSRFIAMPGPMPVQEQLVTSAQWALGGSGTVALDRLSGTIQRAIFDAARETTIFNSQAERGSTWARHASANACAFCAMLATRRGVYASKAAATSVVGRGKEMTAAERRIRAAGGTRYQGRTAAGGTRTRGTRGLGDKYHDHCHCIAVEVRPGGSYEPPSYVEKWDEAYTDAARANKTKGEYGAIEIKGVLANMRQSLDTK